MIKGWYQKDKNNVITKAPGTVDFIPPELSEADMSPAFHVMDIFHMLE